MTIFAVWTATKVTFAMKIAILTILTPLVGSMRNPMTPHNHVLAMAGCDKWPGSSFSPILDNCHRIYPLKSEFFSWKRLFWPFCPFWWPPCATPWPHSTFFCNGQYWQVFLCRIPLRYWKSFHFFSFFFLYEYEVSWISRFWPFTLIYSPPMGAPTQCMPILVADTLVGAKYLKNCIPNWHFHWFLKKNMWHVSLAIFGRFGALGPPLSQYGYRWAYPTSPYAVFLLIVHAQVAPGPFLWWSDDFSICGTSYWLRPSRC